MEGGRGARASIVGYEKGTTWCRTSTYSYKHDKSKQEYFSNQRNLKEAEELEAQVLDMRRKLLGAEHPYGYG